MHPDDIEHAIEATSQQISGIDAIAEFRMVRADGTEVWVMSRAALFTPDEDRAPYVISLQTDITARRNLEERLAREATTDPLTGLLNRNAFMSHVQLALTRHSKAAVGLLFLDLDRFKAVNDTCGHDVGDEVLIRVARAFERVTRSGDVVARLGRRRVRRAVPGRRHRDDRDRGRACRRRRVRADRGRATASSRSV